MKYNELLETVKDNFTTRAVVELHKPLWVDCPCEDKNKCPDLACNTCFNEYKQREDYPCPTIQAIQEHL